MAPADPGTYILTLRCTATRTLVVGRLGRIQLLPGCYLYIGSAFGPGGLRARIGHHSRRTTRPHWHIDYLLAFAEPVEVWYALAGRKLEQDLAGVLERSARWRMSIPRFGASDYHGSRVSHLFHAKRRPAFRCFQQDVNGALGEPIELKRVIVTS